VIRKMTCRPRAGRGFAQSYGEEKKQEEWWWEETRKHFKGNQQAQKAERILEEVLDFFVCELEARDMVANQEGQSANAWDSCTRPPEVRRLSLKWMRV